MRVISLLPSATEIVGVLDLMDQLVGVSHECDYPAEANQRPRVTRCPLHGSPLPSREIDAAVSKALHSQGTLYTLDEELVRRLRPELILTQKLCDVCAVGYGSVARFASTLPDAPRLINLEPATLKDIYADIIRVADALGAPERGVEVVENLRERVRVVRERAAEAIFRPRTVLLEWIDPLFCGGHWNPEIVELAGGEEMIGRVGQPSRRIEWDEVLKARPQVLVLACCGFPVERTLQDLPLLTRRPGFSDLPAVRSGRVYVADGNAYFARPGPRIVDSLEMLAEMLHPELFEGWFPNRGVRRLQNLAG